jgi:alkylation response protein AidB-like acyl-CoA dehydrogenase
VDFAFSPDQQLLKNSARAFLDEHGTSAFVRRLMDDSVGHDEGAWKELAQLGWLGLTVPDAYGGAGLGLVETAIVLEEMGRAAYPGPYFATVVLGGSALAAAGNAAQKDRWLTAIAAGQARATLALQEEHLDWGGATTTTRAEATATGYALTGVKRFVPWAHVADVLLIPARGPEGVSLFLVEASAPGLRLSPLTGIDLSTRWSEVQLAATPAVLVGDAGQAAPTLDAVLRRAAVAAAAEMLGAARKCLELSVEYAKVREQFGQPIGSFQAIRHKCAEMLLEVENSHAATYYAAWAQDAGADDAALAASVAKAYVGDAARRVCGEAIQVHGGIGFTWEYDLHLYFKRAKSLEGLYGDADWHREQIVRLTVERGETAT